MTEHMNNKTAAEKKSFAAVDYFRIIASVLVLAAHIHPFKSIDGYFSFAFDYGLCRVTVPFFFLTTGFFTYHKLQSREYAASYIKRLLKLYALYTVIYIPVNLIDYTASGKPAVICVLSYIRNVLLLGAVPPLWYFIGTAFAVLLLRILKTKAGLRDRTIFVITLALYVTGVLFNSYKEPFLKIPVLGQALKAYYFVFKTTRSGLFYGMFFIFLGGMIKKHMSKIKKRWFYPVLAAVFISCMSAEAIMARTHFAGADCDMLFSAAPAAVFLFLTLIFIKLPEKLTVTGQRLRKVSVLFFGLHPFVSFWLEPPMRALGINNSFLKFAVITAILSALSAIILRLSDKKGFAFLKQLY